MPETDGLSQPAGSAPRCLALIADDAPDFRATLAETVKAFDPAIRVVEAANGIEARNILLKRRPELAFINLQLSQMTGAEALAWSVARSIRPFTVLMSGVALAKWIEVATELHAYEFLRKPFDPAHVTHMLSARRRMTTPMPLLLAEGSASARQLVRRVLADTRFALQIDETDDGRHALELMRFTRYDAVLIDRNLPGLDGLELACQAAQLAPGTRLLLMAAAENASLSQAVRQFGIAALLKKPFYAWDVELALHTAFGLRRPYLLNALPTHYEAEAKRAAGRRVEPTPSEAAPAGAAAEPKNAEPSVFYL